MLMNYPDEASAHILYTGFKYGFPINYTGPRTPVECKNLKSIYKNPQKAFEKIQSEIDLNHIAGPYDKRPISNLRCSPIGLVPKKNWGFQINYTTFVHNWSVISYINSMHSSVQYSPFDHAVSLIQRAGKTQYAGNTK